jgi:hypothetical protein
MVKDQSFSNEVNENPYSHLREFEQICACLHIEGMSYETLRWKLFPFSLIEKAKHWYRHHVKRSKGNWEALSSSFCLQFFPIYKVVKLRVELLTFKQQKNEPLGKL